MKPKAKRLGLFLFPKLFKGFFWVFDSKNLNKSWFSTQNPFKNQQNYLTLTFELLPSLSFPKNQKVSFFEMTVNELNEKKAEGLSMKAHSGLDLSVFLVLQIKTSPIAIEYFKFIFILILKISQHKTEWISSKTRTPK